MTERTFSIIKPDATRRNLTGAINAEIEGAGLRIGARRRTYILRLEEVPMLDPTGALAFADLLGRMQADDAEVIVSGAGHAVLKSLMQATPRDRLKRVHFVKSFATARKRVEAARAGA